MKFVVKLSLIFIVVVIVGWMLFAAYLWSVKTQDSQSQSDYDVAAHFILHLGVITVLLFVVCLILRFTQGVAMISIVSGLGFIGLMAALTWFST